MPFRDFCQASWSLIDSAPLIWGWHLDEICDALEDAAIRRYAGEPVSLAIAAPPGATKSRPISILWQPWVWTWWPGSAWITTSWDEPLAYEFSLRSMDLVRSDWYQGLRPLRIRGGSSRWTNDRGGRRIAAGIRTRVIGDHGHFLLGDDLLKEQLVRGASPGQIADAVSTARSFWYGSLGTRAVDHIGCRVATGQLLHVDDPVTVAIRDRGYEPMVFPVTYEVNHPWRSERDQRNTEGELLSSRYSQEKIDAIVRDIGPTAAAAQLWQRPQPAGGQIMQAEYLSHRYHRLPVEIHQAMETGRWGVGQRWLIAGDLSFKGKRQSKRRQGPDWTVYQLWCADGPRRYLIDQARGQWGYREAKLQLALFALRYRVATEIIIEDAANAAALEDDLTGGGLTEADLIGTLRTEGTKPPRGWHPRVMLEPHGGGTEARVRSVEGVWYSGDVRLPIAKWVDGPDGFVAEHLRYSGVEGETDDQVSCSSLALLHLKLHGTAPGWARIGGSQ